MNLKIDPEFWVLESAYKTKMPLKIAAKSSSYEAVINRIHHHLDISSFVSQLMKMIEGGLIQIEKGPKRGGDLVSVEISQDEMHQHLDSDSEFRFFYSLTSNGGELFETLSLPDWDKFVKQTWSVRDGHEVVFLESKNNKFLQDYCQHVQIAPTGSVASKVSEKTITPFEAVYWKTFATATQIRYDLADEELTLEHLKQLRTSDDLNRDEQFTRWRKFGYSRFESELDFKRSIEN